MDLNIEQLGAIEAPVQAEDLMWGFLVGLGMAAIFAFT